MGGPATIRHPSELRAIPNNAILQQLGWMANTLQGIGAGAARNPPVFAEMRSQSPRFRLALDLAGHALARSDLEVLRAVVATLDPGTWLDRAGHARIAGRREQLVAVARALERLGLGAPVQAMFRRVQADHVALRAHWPDAPVMPVRLAVLHALRLALVHRIWLLETAIPDFSPRFGVTRQALEARILRLDIPGATALLAEVFPASPDPAVDRDYAEPAGPRSDNAYAREHAEIFGPMLRLFALIREIGTAITHEVGAFG
jgi:phosphoenolpyruvate carboxylase